MKENIQNVYTADFETTGRTNYDRDGYVRVWLWSLVSLDCERKYHGTNIESFLEKLNELKATKVWFHNLRFDGSFILYYCVSHNKVWNNDYSAIIDGMNTWYEVRLKLPNTTVTIWDSLKKFPGQSVEAISKLYKIEGKKDYPDFSRYFPEDYQPTQDEIDYCVQDSYIIAYALKSEYSKGRTSMTLSADAFKDVKSLLGGFVKWRNIMPKLTYEEDSFIRLSYKGGFVWLNPKFEGKEVNNVWVHDVNSLYPYVMRNCELPYGKPLFRDEPFPDELYVIQFKSEFKLKDGFIPTIQIKSDPRYKSTEYVTESKGVTTLTLTNIDYVLFKEHYDIEYITEPKYCCFSKKVGLLKDYIDYWMNIKIAASKSGDAASRYLAKRNMNSPYGKTGMRPDRVNKYPTLDEDGDLQFGEQLEMCDGIYIPYATFVCAQARNITIRSAQKEYDHFIYADTDSIHLLGESHSGLWVDDNALGAWKIEGKFEVGKYLRPKTYLHATKDHVITDIKCAGMPDEVKDLVTWDNFKIGSEYSGKLLQTRVKGGCMLCPTTFKLNKNYMMKD